MTSKQKQLFLFPRFRFLVPLGFVSGRHDGSHSQSEQGEWGKRGAAVKTSSHPELWTCVCVISSDLETATLVKEFLKVCLRCGHDIRIKLLMWWLWGKDWCLYYIIRFMSAQTKHCVLVPHFWIRFAQTFGIHHCHDKKHPVSLSRPQAK